ncbi:unnamed protein product [Rhodiola kirilowii]
MGGSVRSVCVLIASVILSIVFLGEASEYPAMFVIGDSLVDSGNNNYLNSLAKSNYFPYGIDYPQGPSGRFNNGKTIVDFLGELIGIPSIPTYADPLIRQKGINRGVNFASAAGGILEESGSNLGEHLSFESQVRNLKRTIGMLKEQMGDVELGEYLAKSLVVVVLGSNDYINNYLVPSMYPPSYAYDSESYAQLLINLYAAKIQAVHDLGLRKFFLAGVGPLGCIPNQLASSLITRPGECVTRVNDLVKSFNKRLISLVDQLNANHNHGSVFSYGNTFDAFIDIISNPSKYGFQVSNKGCCGVGKNRGQITCLPLEMPCANREQYVFWDAYHPTEAVNKIFAQRAYTGPTSDCYPVNIKQMAQM